MKSPQGRVSVVAMGGVLFLAGCVQGEEVIKASNLPDRNVHSEIVTDKVLSNKPDVFTQLEAADMYQFMVAEMMVQKGFEAQAFEIVFKLANKLRHAELAERAFQLSMKTYNAQKIEDATFLWREIAPQEVLPWRASFLIALRHDDVELALKNWQHYRGLSKESLERDLLLAAKKISVSSPPESGVVFLQALTDLYPDTWASFFALGLVADAFNRYDVALVALEAAKKVQVENSEQQINQFLAKLYLQTKPAERGILALTPYLEKYPQDWLVQERMARLEVQAGLYDEAVKRYTHILTVVPDAHTSRLSLALLEIEQKNYKKAEGHLLKVITEKGYAEVAGYYLGLIYQEQKDDEKALAYFEQIKSKNYYIDAQLHRAEIYFSANKMKDAFDVLNKAEATQPKDRIKLHRAKGIFYGAANEDELAIDEFQKVLDIDQNDVSALMNQAMLFYKLNQFNDYVDNLKRVLDQAPNEVDALNALGYFYVDRGERLDEAEQLLMRAYHLAPNNYYVLDSVGWLYFQQKNYELARQYLHKSLAIQIDDEVLIHLISTYWQIGEKEKAKKIWNEHHEKFLQNNELQGLIHHLEAN